jgi:hypothetical protein
LERAGNAPSPQIVESLKQCADQLHSTTSGH